MSNLNEYYKAFTTRSEEEIAINKEINAENERFENIPEVIAHREKIKSLYNKENDIFKARIEAARSARKRTLSGKPLPVEKKKVEKDPKVEELIEKINALSVGDKIYVGRSCFSEDIPKDEENTMSHDDVLELHEILVQTVLDYINEKGLKNIWSVSFSADALQASADYGTWCPETDSFLKIEGLKNEKFTRPNGEETEVSGRVVIGESY